MTRDQPTSVIALEGGGHARYLYQPPAGEAPEPAGCVVVFPGLGARPFDDGPYQTLSEALRQAGFAVLRFVWEGAREAYELVSDVEAAIAVIDSLAEQSRLDRATLVLFGHSLGGLVAPLVAAAISARRVVVYGAAARRWAEALEHGAKRQLPLRGVAPEASRRESADAARLYRSVLRDGHTRSTLATSAPELLACVAARDLSEGELHGAPLRYLRSVDALEPSAVWGSVCCPVVLLQGEHDWVVGEGDAVQIAAWARAAGAACDVRPLAHADHYFSAHADVAASLRDAGRTKASPAIVAAVVAACRDDVTAAPDERLRRRKEP